MQGTIYASLWPEHSMSCPSAICTMGVCKLTFFLFSYSGPDLARKLSQLVKMEKNVMRSMELVGRERREVARQLSIWGEECDEDVSDITDKLGVLIFEIGELEDQFIDRYDQYRVTIKSIRNIEASVQPSRDRRFPQSQVEQGANFQ